ncbi:MAG: shikimate dehydrogenase [Balneolaceae bacterium]|nr:shikimate dehydrogenase [Balneolaceae bacterium]
MALTFRDFRESEVSGQPHFLVIGHPISHSLSPLMHRTAIREYRLNAEYVAINLLSDEITSFISWCNRDEFLGCNITIPYKETLLDLVDELDSPATHIGAINTIYKYQGRLVGSNTDQYGFSEPLKPFLNDDNTNRAMIFGTGGASKAVKAALEEFGFEELIFVSRRANKKIQSEYSEVRVVDYSQWQAFAPETDLFINTTPLGMHPNIDDSPVPVHESELLTESICYDLVYNPLKTTFLENAENHGAEIINGLDMLIHQGSKSFEMWTGKPFPIDLVKKKLFEHFQSI